MSRLNGPATSGARVAIALAAGLALADASVVVLALPPIILEFGASVQGVAAVIGAYTLALSAALPLALWCRRALDTAPGRGTARLGAFGMFGGAVASLACGLSGSLTQLIAMRAVQGAAAAAVLIAAFTLLRANEFSGRGARLWSATAVVGAALGPALGGALTQLLDWRAIFLVQAPVLVASGLACLAVRPVPTPPVGTAPRPPRASVAAVSLGLLSAALTGVLFLLVLLLITGWALSPLEAAGVVSVLPVAALVGTRVPGGDAQRALVGNVLVGAGVLSLAFLPLDTISMTILPQLVAGLGMGMALPALAGGLLPERSEADAARQLAIRHVAATIALVILAPVTAAALDQAAEQVRERGTALILDADLAIHDKLTLAQVATADLHVIAPREALRSSLDQAGGDIEADHPGTYDALSNKADETLVSAFNQAFTPAFLICGGLGLLAALLLLTTRPTVGKVARAASLAALLLIPAQAVLYTTTKPEPVRIADPCESRSPPHTSGLDEFLQGQAMAILDRAACHFGSSREELALGLVDEQNAHAYEDKYGISPRSVSALVALFD